MVILTPILNEGMIEEKCIQRAPGAQSLQFKEDLLNIHLYVQETPHKVKRNAMHWKSKSLISFLILLHLERKHACLNENSPVQGFTPTIPGL